MTTVNLLPSVADGNYSGFSISGGAAHYVLVDDPVGIPDDIATWIGAGEANRDSFSFAGAALPVGATVNSIKVHLRWLADSTVAWDNFVPFFRTGATDYDNANEKFTNVTSWVDFTHDDWKYLTDPSTGLAWTRATVNGNMEWGLKCIAVDFQFTYITQKYLEVDFTEAGAGWTGEIIGVTNPSEILGIAVANIDEVIAI